MSEFESFVKQPEECCSTCMETCINLSDCETCSLKLKKNLPNSELSASKKMIHSLRDFLITLNINNKVLQPTPPYCEETLASVILQKLATFNAVSDIVNYLQIFNFMPQITSVVADFIMTTFIDATAERTVTYEDLTDDDSEDSGDCEDISDTSEYFDEDTDDS